ncbi:MAG: GGDEF domain-containing phosphodiesterase [Lachnospiraceae bacterium]|nr:GGDEF domain-containing phosphodiesterase [Lachnospiraceae bacterium]
MYEIVSKEFIDFINKLDLSESRSKTLYRDIFIRLADMAAFLYVARVEVNYKTRPNIFDLDGDNVDIVHDFSPKADRTKPAIRMKFKRDLGDVRVTLRVVEGYEWTKNDKDAIEALVKNVYLAISRASMMSQLSKTADTDMMTGLLNHSGIINIGRSALYRDVLNYYFGCYFNIKNFKMFNKKLGVEQADKILKDYAKHIYKFIDEESELAARLSGDNFFVLIVKSRLDDFIKHATSAVFSVKSLDGKPMKLPISVRMGIYEAEAGDTISDVVNRSTEAATHGRSFGDDISYFNADIQARVRREKEIMAMFPEALANGEIIAYYQPKIRLRTMEICGCEALVRWFHDGKLISPGEFLPVVEKNNATKLLDYYMLETACYEIRSWLDKGLTPIRISVNYSKQHLAESDLAKHTIDIIKKHKIDPKYIEIELTETAEYDDNAALIKFVSDMNAAGIHVSMDDFGTGSSSLNLLLTLDFDVVKVDKSFVDNIGLETDAAIKDEIMISNMINMLRELNMEVVAEGVETPTQLEWIKNKNCDIVQGYVFDKPLKPEDIRDRLVNRVYKI